MPVIPQNYFTVSLKIPNNMVLGNIYIYIYIYKSVKDVLLKVPVHLCNMVSDRVWELLFI